jgi:hypothetical protein
MEPSSRLRAAAGALKEAHRAFGDDECGKSGPKSSQMCRLKMRIESGAIVINFVKHHRVRIVLRNRNVEAGQPGSWATDEPASSWASSRKAGMAASFTLNSAMTTNRRREAFIMSCSGPTDLPGFPGWSECGSSRRARDG